MSQAEYLLQQRVPSRLPTVMNSAAAFYKPLNPALAPRLMHARIPKSRQLGDIYYNLIGLYNSFTIILEAFF